MKITNKLSAMLMICVISLFVSLFGARAQELDTVVSLQIDNPIMHINGAQAEIDKGRGTTPIINNGRTLVPIRAIIEAFGGTVAWDDQTRTVTLAMKDDIIKLVIDNKTARLNNRTSTLDVAPAIINGRTMLPIRYVAEGFNLGVAWENDTRRVFVVRNSFDDEEYQRLMSMVPSYKGQPYVKINNNKPFFKEYEIIEGSFEFYADLDSYGRCDVAMASVGTDIMPTEKRKSISSVIPTGWKNESYSFVDGGYVYNRCHLIGFQLTGENANERNLITGTRYLNVEGMLPFENMIRDYIDKTDNNVVYRSTPVFTEDNLVADGVLLEAYSVEDNGKGLTFCVYCYNVQPDIFIDYATGANSLMVESPPAANSQQGTDISSVIYRTPSGKRYHLDADCGGKNSYEITMEKARAAGLTPCSKCAM